MTIAPARATSREPAAFSLPGGAGPAGEARRAAIVTAILVVHDGATWLRECLDALALQSRPPDRLVVVDTGSSDDSRAIVVRHRGVRAVVDEFVVISAPRDSTFGEAVGGAVEQLSAGSDGCPSPGPGEWLWLLHDDSAAAPKALEHLLDAGRRSPSVAVAGPKLTTWEDPSRLLEVGQQVTRSGGRAGGPAAGEPDQGQHDHRGDVLGVNTSGMLIRRDVFEALGGFDPAFGQFRDDVDLCWRAHLAGHRVVVVPRARMREAAASANGRRSPGRSAAAARRLDHRHGAQVALARCSPYAAPLLGLWIAFASLTCAAVLLLVKRPRRAWEELGGLESVLTPASSIGARWRSRGTRRVRRRDLRGLFATRRTGFSEALDSIHDAVAAGSDSIQDERFTPAQGLETGPASDEGGSGDSGDSGESLERPRLGLTSRMLRHPGLLAAVVAVLAAVATWRSLLLGLISSTGQGLAGGELLPASAGASGLWHGWLDGWHGAGLGNALQPAPYLPVLSAVGWVLEHQPFVVPATASAGTSIGWLLTGAVPLSAGTAYLAARVVTRAPWPRAWAALAWASLATLTTAQADGRLGAVVAHILLPLVAAGFVCAARGSSGLWATFAGSLALGVTGAFNPALAALGACAAVVLLVVGHGATRLRAAVLLLVPAGLLGPWILALVDNPRLLLAGPGLTFWQGSAPAPWQLAMLHPGGPGSYPALFSAPIVLAGVIAMVRRGAASRAMTVLAVVTVTGLALGLASPHVTIGRVPAGLAGAGGPVTAWAGTGLDLAALALIAAAVLGLNGLSGRLSRSGFGWRQVLVAPLVGAAVLGVVASLAAAGWSGVGQTLSADVSDTPAVAVDQAGGPLGSRLLELSSDAGTIGYRLVGREPGSLVRDLAGPVAPANPLLAAAVRTVLSEGDGASANAASLALAGQGVGFVSLRGPPTQPLVRRLDATAGMTRLGDSTGLILWRVLPGANVVSSSRLRLVDAEGDPLQSVAVTGDHGRTDVMLGALVVAKASTGSVRPGAVTRGEVTPGRRLVVAEPAAWADHARVTYAGRELAVLAGGDQPAYVLPPTAGRLTISIAPTQPWWRWCQLALLLGVLFLALPIGSSRSRTTL